MYPKRNDVLFLTLLSTDNQAITIRDIKQPNNPFPDLLLFASSPISHPEKALDVVRLPTSQQSNREYLIETINKSLRIRLLGYISPPLFT